jgi:hypothetical protein
MATHVWNEYEAVVDSYRMVQTTLEAGVAFYTSVKYYDTYNFDSKTGEFSLTGNYVTASNLSQVPMGKYFINGGDLFITRDINTEYNRIYMHPMKVEEIYIPGNLRGTVTSTSRSAYPDNAAKNIGWGEYRYYMYQGLLNNVPTVTLNTTNNRTLYENDTFSIDGTTRDTDSGNVVNVKYQINSGTVRAIATQISNGSAFPFNKVLTFKQNKLYDGANAVTADLAEGTQHVLKVWAEDDQGGKSAEQIRTFYVVPNRPATLTVEPFSTRTDLIDSDSITVNGSVSDPDNNTVTVKYKIANGSFTEVYNGGSGSFSFNVTLADLAVGANTITVQAVDSYGAITSKTLSVNKAENNQLLLTSVARYKLTPPNGTAKGAVLWIQREVGDLVVDAEISMGMNGQSENFQPMTKESTAFVTEGIEEDEFTFDNATDAENIILKLTMTRSSTASDKGIKLISGVLS